MKYARSMVQKVSLTDVAKVAHVSAQTVSRVVNRTDNVTDKTRDKVLAAMERLNYRPNLAARALKRGGFKTIGIALFDITATGNIQTIQGISNAANDNGYALVLDVFDLNKSNTITNAVQRMQKLPIDGILVALEQVVSDIDTYTPAADLPVNLITSYPSKTMETIDANQYACSQEIVDYFLESGHQNVYYVSGPESSTANEFRVAGWRDALESRGIEPPPIVQGDWSADSGYRAGRTLAHVEGCTAIYAANDAMANGVIGGLLAEGKHVPSDISVIGVDNALKEFVPELILTSMDLGTAQVGYQAFTNLVGKVEKIEKAARPTAITHTLLSGQLIERSSVARI